MANVYQRIPMSTGRRPKRFSVQLGGISYRFTMRWANRLGGWYMNVERVDGGTPIRGVRMVAQTPLLAQYKAHAGALPTDVFLFDAERTFDEPTADDMGERWQLLHAFDDGT